MLSRELKKVQRRVNALEKVLIPPHEEAKKYIADRIEEMEREEVFVKKLIRHRMSKGKSAAGQSFYLRVRIRQLHFRPYRSVRSHVNLDYFPLLRSSSYFSTIV